jgi:AraC family ethanolamine operon transcriptional activator
LSACILGIRLPVRYPDFDTGAAMVDQPGNPQPLQSVLFDSFDPDTMTDALQQGALDHVQLARGRFRGSIQRAQASAARIDWGRYNLPVLAAGTLAQDCVSLGFIVSAVDDGYVNGERVQTSDVILMPEGDELYFRLAPGTEWISFQVRRALLERLGVELIGRRPGVVPIADAERTNLRHVVADVGQLIGPDRDPAEPVTRGEVEWAQEELLAAFAEALAGTDVPDRQRPSGAERLRIVGAVESYLESHVGETLRIDDLCSTVGTNLHTLERAFAEVQGISPKRFLTFRRLALARKDLLRAAPGSTSVTDVATHWGFFHLSRFAAEYKALFHESPSETLQRVRSRG